MKNEEQKTKEKAVKDLMELILDDKTSHEVKRNSMFLLLTEYDEYLNHHFDKERQSLAYIELYREVQASTLFCPVLIGFDADGNPLMVAKYILLPENATLEEKCETVENICIFAKATIELNKRWKKCRQYESLQKQSFAKEEKCKMIEQIWSFANATIELSKKQESSQEYEQFKEEYLLKYNFELAKEENKWIRERFFPEIKTRKRENN